MQGTNFERRQGELRAIFDNPQPVHHVTQRQFEGQDEQLRDIARRRWSQLGWESLYVFEEDLTYLMAFQQELFDYLFPASLLSWLDQIERRKPPLAMANLYMAFANNLALERMMLPDRREKVCKWMAKEFCLCIETISESESSGQEGAEVLHFFLESFNSLGESFPVHASILEDVIRADSIGKCRFLLTLAAGLSWRVQEVPWVKPWSASQGGGGIYLLEVAASTFHHGFLPENMNACRSFLTIDGLVRAMQEGSKLSESQPETERFEMCAARLVSHRDYAEAKLKWYFKNMQLPELERDCFEERV